MLNCTKTFHNYISTAIHAPSLPEFKLLSPLVKHRSPLYPPELIPSPTFLIPLVLGLINPEGALFISVKTISYVDVPLKLEIKTDYYAALAKHGP